MYKYLKDNISHISSNPEAIDLARVGAVGCIVLTTIAVWCGLGGVVIINMLLFGALIVGIYVELIKRITRASDSETGVWLGYSGPHQNTARKSILNVIITWWFLVTYYKILKK